MPAGCQVRHAIDACERQVARPQRLAEREHAAPLARFGAGNIAGQTALDMAQAAVDSWLRRVALGARVSSDEMVLRFRAGAEPIRFLTGERSDAPTLHAFDRVSAGSASHFVQIVDWSRSLTRASSQHALAAGQAAGSRTVTHGLSPMAGLPTSTSRWSVRGWRRDGRRCAPAR